MNIIKTLQLIVCIICFKSFGQVMYSTTLLTGQMKLIDNEK